MIGERHKFSKYFKEVVYDSSIIVDTLPAQLKELAIPLKNIKDITKQGLITHSHDHS